MLTPLTFTYLHSADDKVKHDESVESLNNNNVCLPLLYNDDQSEPLCICLATMVLFYLTNF